MIFYQMLLIIVLFEALLSGGVVNTKTSTITELEQQGNVAR